MAAGTQGLWRNTYKYISIKKVMQNTTYAPILKSVASTIAHAAGMAKQAYAAAHHRTGGLSTLALMRGPAIVSGLIAGAVALDHLLDQNFHLHLFNGGWVAGAEHEAYEANSNYTRRDSVKIDGCQTEYSYRRTDNPSLGMTVTHNSCAQKASTSTADSLDNICIAITGAILLALGGAYLWYRKTGQTRTKANVAPINTEYTTRAVEPDSRSRINILRDTLAGVENSLSAGILEERVAKEMQADIRARLGVAVVQRKKELGGLYARGRISLKTYRRLIAGANQVESGEEE
jgi:hypothetical protein